MTGLEDRLERVERQLRELTAATRLLHRYLRLLWRQSADASAAMNYGEPRRWPPADCHWLLDPEDVPRD